MVHTLQPLNHLPTASTHLADAILQDVTEVAALAMTIHLAQHIGWHGDGMGRFLGILSIGKQRMFMIGIKILQGILWHSAK